MRRLARINGRTDDMLIIRGVNVFPSQLEELILKSGVFSPAYLIEVEREGHLDRLTINVEWAAGMPASPSPPLSVTTEDSTQTQVLGGAARLVTISESVLRRGPSRTGDYPRNFQGRSQGFRRSALAALCR